jgi:hypothetical protein
MRVEVAEATKEQQPAALILRSVTAGHASRRMAARIDVPSLIALLPVLLTPS